MSKVKVWEEKASSREFSLASFCADIKSKTNTKALETNKIVKTSERFFLLLKGKITFVGEKSVMFLLFRSLRGEISREKKHPKYIQQLFSPREIYSNIKPHNKVFHFCLCSNSGILTYNSLRIIEFYAGNTNLTPFLQVSKLKLITNNSWVFQVKHLKKLGTHGLTSNMHFLTSVKYKSSRIWLKLISD